MMWALGRLDFQVANEILAFLTGLVTLHLHLAIERLQPFFLEPVRLDKTIDLLRNPPQWEVAND